MNTTLSAAKETGSITTGTYPSPLGELVVTFLDGRICHLHFGEDGAETSARRFLGHHGIEVRETIIEPIPKEVAEQLDAYFNKSLSRFDLPLTLFGTPFQRLVWDELLKIPFGTTESYSGLSRRIGRPDAVRAVGSANGSNPAPLIVPCHRIIGSEGNLRGYAYGIEVKQALLVHEGILLA